MVGYRRSVAVATSAQRVVDVLGKKEVTSGVRLSAKGEGEGCCAAGLSERAGPSEREEEGEALCGLVLVARGSPVWRRRERRSGQWRGPKRRGGK